MSSQYKSNYNVKQTRFYQCERKVLFVTRTEAQNRANRINKKNRLKRIGKKRNRQFGVQLEPYRCPHCKGFHLRKKKRKSRGY